MEHSKLVSPGEMVGADHKIFVTADINQALIDYGFIVKSDFLKWFALGDDYSNKQADDLLTKICNAMSRNELPTNIQNEVCWRVNKFLEELPGRKRVALAFIMFNSKKFFNSVKENIDVEEITGVEFQALLSREIKKQVYVCGNHEMETNIKEYLVDQAIRFASEFRYEPSPAPAKRVIEIVELYAKQSFASIGI